MENITKHIAFSMILAPLLMLLADSIDLIFEYPEYFWFSSISMFLSFYVFLGLIYGVYYLSKRTKLALVGALITSFGVLAGETILGLERVAWAMNEIGLNEEIKNTVYHPVVFSTSRKIGLAFPIGLIILGISKFKARVINLVTVVILLIGIVLFPVGRIAIGPSANVLGDFIMLLIYGKLGIDLLKQNKQIHN